jgi:hypothetical protein
VSIDLHNPSDGRARDRFGRIWVTTARGAAEAGVTEAAIRDWTRRRLITGQLANGRRWYRLEQLQALEAAAYLRAQARATQVDDGASIPPQSDHHHALAQVAAAHFPNGCVIDTVEDGPCGRPVAPHARWNICDLHLGDICVHYRAHIRRSASGTYVLEHPTPQDIADAGRARLEAAERVYYIQFADRVKIGTTRDLKQRLAELPFDEVLAVEPGGRDLEKLRHTQFAQARIYTNREWFVLTDELRSHCDMLVKHYGPPTAHLGAAA